MLFNFNGFWKKLEKKEKFLFEKELLNRVSDIKNKKVTPLSRDEVFDGV